MSTRSLKKWALLLTFWIALHTSALRAQLLGPYGTSPITFEVDANGLLSATGTYGGTGSLSLSGTGTRMFWYPQKAAFRAGGISGTDWNDSNIGVYSAAFGYNTTASGGMSTASGYGAKANGYISTAFGENSTASGAASMAFGQSTTASGYQTTASGYGTTASGDLSASFGLQTNTQSIESFAIGRWNVGGGTGTGHWWVSGSWVGTDPLFEVGNGTTIYARADAFVVYKNGNAAVQGTFTAQGTIASHSTVRCNAGGDLSMGSFTAGTAP